MEIDCDASEVDALVEAWARHARTLLDAVGWRNEQTAWHRLDSGGVLLALSAPIDTLYAAVDVNDAAWRRAEAELRGVPPPSEDVLLPPLRDAIRDERNPRLIALADAAAKHHVTLLWDDDEVSLGLGRYAQTWPSNALPDPGDVDWAQRGDIPVGLVTGTNGKTTSVRMAACIVRAAGLNAGFSSTDWVGVNQRIIDRGDYSGPGGARAVLRDRAVDAAVLETARGGLLRRGLGVAHADAALITTIAEDHLGDFGSHNLQQLLDVKWIVTRALGDTGSAVLNAEDPLLVAKAVELVAPILWFALDPNNPTLSAHVQAGGQATTVIDGALSRFDGNRWRALCAINDIPLTMNGAARHNVANALAAAGLTHAMGIDDDAIVRGLTGMTAVDNPGRGNIYDVDGVEVLVDFAHNPQGMAAIFDLASRHPAKRRLLAFAQAGDRTDKAIREQAQVAWRTGFDRILVSELAHYHRGRDHGEIFALLRDEFRSLGATEGQVVHFEEELDALHHALDWARPGDLVIMLALGDARNIMAELDKRGSERP
jgi:UDP-N-acetylmuramyl tripeptide synthase